ncbi:hypothetical protein HPP92_001577 [Vanilla planifolia]|uniref:Uncharacterized protein n=1 Tax=Vanilla planifolia TaxID=51239 RepID=A0A835VLI7_VANPL|nr:hypothetical protein HPP92_001577 [Vanilla planifolia]
MRLGRERLADAGVLPASVFCAFVRSRSGGVLHEEDSVRRAMRFSGSRGIEISLRGYNLGKWGSMDDFVDKVGPCERD